MNTRTYLELKRALPNLGRRVESVQGNGKVIRQNILKQTVLFSARRTAAWSRRRSRIWSICARPKPELNRAAWRL